MNGGGAVAAVRTAVLVIVVCVNHDSVGGALVFGVTNSLALTFPNSPPELVDKRCDFTGEEEMHSLA